MMNDLFDAFSEDLIPIPLKLFQKVEEEGILPNSFDNAGITLIYHKKRKLTTNIPDEHTCENTQQNTSKQNSKMHQTDPLQNY